MTAKSPDIRPKASEILEGCVGNTPISNFFTIVKNASDSIIRQDNEGNNEIDVI
jgi:hypothetical protein